MLEAFPIAQQPSMIVTKVIATLRQIVENKAGLLESEVKVEQRQVAEKEQEEARITGIKWP